MKNRILKILLKSKITVISVIVLFTIVGMCVFIPMFYPADYYAHIDLENVSKAPSMIHIFGTDHLGRDIFIRVLEGGRISLEIALIATIVSILIGTIYGAVAGYIGGKVDAIMMRIVDALYAIPFLFFSILLMTIFNRDFRMMFVAIAFVSWLDIARIVRGQTIGIKYKEFILAAKVNGKGTFGIIFRHILPSLFNIVFLYATLTVPSILSLTASLGFLGLGIQPPMTGWGEMISDGSAYLLFGYWWMILPPALFLALTLLSLNFIGNSIRKIIDPRQE